MLLVDEDNARGKIRSLLSGTHPGARPEAIVTGSDRLAVMIYGMAAELGLRIGRDLAVTGFDGSIPADLLHPRLTSVSIPVEDIAERVVTRALGQVRGADDSRGGSGEASLRLGESTGGGREPRPEAGTVGGAELVQTFPGGVELPGARRWA